MMHAGADGFAAAADSSVRMLSRRQVGTNVSVLFLAVACLPVRLFGQLINWFCFAFFIFINYFIIIIIIMRWVDARGWFGNPNPNAAGLAVSGSSRR